MPDAELELLVVQGRFPAAAGEVLAEAVDRLLRAEAVALHDGFDGPREAAARSRRSRCGSWRGGLFERRGWPRTRLGSCASRERGSLGGSALRGAGSPVRRAQARLLLDCGIALRIDSIDHIFPFAAL